MGLPWVLQGARVFRRQFLSNGCSGEAGIRNRKPRKPLHEDNPTSNDTPICMLFGYRVFIFVQENGRTALYFQARKGLEPAHPREYRHLQLASLPFRHPGPNVVSAGG